MRKRTVFVALLILIVLSVAVGCAASDPFKKSVVSGLEGVFGPIWLSLTAGWVDFAAVMGGSGTYFLAYTLSLLVVGGLIFVLLNRAKNAGKLPLPRSSSGAGLSGLTGLQSEPAEPERQSKPAPKVVEEPQQVAVEEETVQ